MGPAIRTQVSSAMSPRQHRIRTSGLRSASDPNLHLSNNATNTSLDLTETLRSTHVSGDRRTSTGAHVLDQQHFTDITPTNLHSQPRRRKLRRSLYHSSVDLSGRRSLAPVIESDLSPLEEKQLQSFDFVLPIAKSNAADSPTGLGITTVTSVASMDRDRSALPQDSKQKPPRHNDIYLLANPGTLYNSLPNLHHFSQGELGLQGLDTLSDNASILTIMPETQQRTTKLTSNEVETGHHSDTQVSSMPQGSVSSPELTCSSSLSSEEGATSRSSISSISSDGELPLSTADVEDSMDKVAKLREPPPVFHRGPSRSKNLSVKIDKASKILGPGSPTAASKELTRFSNPFGEMETGMKDERQIQVRTLPNPVEHRGNKLMGILRNGSRGGWSQHWKKERRANQST